MSRVAKTLPISPQLFRHFAIITVGITLCVAMFADGENRQTIEDEFAEREARNELLRADATRGANRPLLRRAPTKGSFGPDIDVASSEFDPIEETGPSRGGTTTRYRSGSVGEGMSEAAIAAASAPRMEVGTDGKPRPIARRPLPPRPTPEQIQALQESSRLRSGGTGDGD